MYFQDNEAAGMKRLIPPHELTRQAESNPMVMWGKYHKGLLKTTLPVSFQFHHVQMDGGHAARFLQLLQDEIKIISKIHLTRP